MQPNITRTATYSKVIAHLCIAYCKTLTGCCRAWELNRGLRTVSTKMLAIAAASIEKLEKQLEDRFLFCCLSNMDSSSLANRIARFVRLYFSAGKRIVQEISGTHLALTGAAVLLAAGVVYAIQHRVPADIYKQRRLRVLVTGGTKGLGAALVQQFIALGDDVIVAARHASKIDTSKRVWDNQRIVMMECDMSKPDQVEELGFQIIEKFGSLDLWYVSCDVLPKSSVTLRSTAGSIMRASLKQQKLLCGKLPSKQSTQLLAQILVRLCMAREWHYGCCRILTWAAQW